MGDLILLPRRMYGWLSRNRLWSEDVLLKEALLDEFLQVPSEGPTVVGFVSLTLVVGAIFLRPGE